MTKTRNQNLEFPAELEITPDFKRAFEMMEETRQSAFITGRAGTGKSTLLRYFKENTAKNAVVVAPTGVAAINVRGQTIHSFFQFPPKLIHKDNVRRLKNSKIFEKMDTLVIDEVSMVRADVLDGIDYSLRLNRENLDEPFGGVQVILFGDMFQLPPIVDREAKEFLSLSYATPYFFSANVFQKFSLKYIELNKIFRQKDEEFLNLLEKIRNKQADETDLVRINSQVSQTELDHREVITLTTTNHLAHSINEKELRKLPHPEAKFDAQVLGKFEENTFPTEYSLRLKKNAQIMLLRNDEHRRWVNGTIATVHDVQENAIQIKVEKKVYDLPRVKWEKIEYTFNELEGKIEEKVVGSFEQFPLRLAWAITIHKSQGQTFENVVIDFGHGAFAHGQAYVALSRCVSLKGITLKRPLMLRDIILDQRILKFRAHFLED